VTGPNDRELIDFAGAAPVAGSLDVAWQHGTRRSGRTAQPAIQVHHHDEHTVILRQSKAVHYEAPFLFLLFGNDRALLIDTGAVADPGRFPLRTTVDGLVASWLERHPREDYGLVVAHTHGHGDHVAGDVQFAGRSGTVVVPRELGAVREFFGFDAAAWPDQTVSFDLGGRVLEVFGSPGHHESAITWYDPWTGILLTGDTVLPGRLYAFDFTAFRATLDRMAAFAENHRVTHLFGCHVEMSNRPGRDYPIGATWQPDERVPQLAPERLFAIREAVWSAAVARRGVHRFEDFIVYHEPRPTDMIRLTLRGLVAKAGFRRP
jgi:hydroxyacylglutathione hydrolase